MPDKSSTLYCIKFDEIATIESWMFLRMAGGQCIGICGCPSGKSSHESDFHLVKPCNARHVSISMPEIVDDKSEHCIPFILERLKQHREHYESKGETPPPFFLGLNGVQGAGKTTLVCG